MSGALRFVCIERVAIPTRYGVKLAGVAGRWSLIRRGAVVDGDNPVLALFPENFRPQAPEDLAARPITFGRKEDV